MSDLRRMSSFREWLPPLVAVLVLIGPTTALAAAPAPDAPAPEAPQAQTGGSGGGLSPDPAPRAAPPAVHKVHVTPRHVQTTPTRVVTVQRAAPETQDATNARVVPTKPVTPVRTATKPRLRHHAHVLPPKHRAAVRLTDVTPLAVDLHPNLGAVAAPLLDHSTLVLAAIALLAAVAAAGSGAALVLTARELL
jgi:hypothetical protein